VDLLLLQAGGTRSDVRLQLAFEGLIDRIAALDVRALREADGVTEASSSPAAIDEVLTAAMFESPAPLATTAETVAADFERNPGDIPIPLNGKVLSYVELYQGRLRDFMQAGLDRSQRYLPMIQAIFREEGVPLDLAFVPLVESAFLPNALSRASARGMWQFMSYTGKEYGLRLDWFIDERSDPAKATRAAARYFKTLRDTFDGDWAFALASYNAGPGRLQGAAKKAKSSDFWTISASTRYLPRETREYVPMIMAAIIVGRNPELYGFQITPAAPLAYETVEIPGALDLKIIAEWAGLPLERLLELNPELRRTTTPMTAHALKVPIGTGAMIESEMASADSLYRSFGFYTVRKGDTLSGIARKYGVSTAALAEANGLSAKARLSIRQTLAVPTPSTSLLPSAASTVPAGDGSDFYRVRAGDTLYGIAKQFSTTVPLLKRWNGLSGDRINIGDRLRIRG
jgi:membrane-bound lytic murein transglycosylase D